MYGNFPFYDSMIKDVKNKDLNTKQKDEFINKINKIDENGIELVYALIRIYEMQHEENSGTFKIPYSGKYVEKNIQFDFEQFPFKLKQILFKFVNIHIKKMEEEHTISEKRPI
jgi:hypothetical protein